MDNKYKVTVSSPMEMIELAQNLESDKFNNMIIALSGDLGSGKTVFVKGFAQAMGIMDITSPTFNIIKEYSGEMMLYHMDMYRLEGNIDNLGLDEYFNKDGVVIIEWADMISDFLPKERLDIEIKVIDENTRLLTLVPHGDKYVSLCEGVL